MAEMARSCLSYRLRLRLQLTRIVDNVAYWLVCGGRSDAAIRLWKLCRMWE